MNQVLQKATNVWSTKFAYLLMLVILKLTKSPCEIVQLVLFICVCDGKNYVLKMPVLTKVICKWWNSKLVKKTFLFYSFPLSTSTLHSRTLLPSKLISV